jgi:predicted Zn-dependent protease
MSGQKRPDRPGADMALPASGLNLLLGTVLLLTGCAINPVTGGRDFTLMSEAEEIDKGRQAASDILKEYGRYDLPPLQAYVDAVGQRLARESHRPQLDYHFTVVDSPQVNAFALPGGHVYVTRGMLAYLNSEAELAAVLGHEIGHVTARHGVRQYSAAVATQAVATVGSLAASILMPQAGGQLAQGLQSFLGLTGNALLSGYGRGHELEADRLGAEYLARTGYDPQAMIQVIGVLKNQELFDVEIARQEGREPRRYHGIFATHPDNDTRLQEVVGEAGRPVRPSGRADGRRTEFLQQIEGIVFGDSVAHGVVRGNTFRHREMGFAVSFPPGWRVRNRPDEVAALSPEGDALVALRLFGEPRGSPADLIRARLRLAPTDRVVSMTRNGLPMALVTASVQNREPYMVAVIYHDDQAFLLAGKGASPAAYDRHRDALADSIGSFRTLADAERAAIRPLTIKIITAAGGVRYADLARDSPLGASAENHLRLLNGHYPDGEPMIGQRLKIVE